MFVIRINMKGTLFFFIILISLTLIMNKSKFSNKLRKQDTIATTTTTTTDQNVAGANTNNPTSPENDISTATIVQPNKPSGTVTNKKSAFCYINDNGIIYDLNSLHNSNIDYRIDTVEGTFSFNFCKNAIHSCTNKAGDEGLGFFTDALDMQCYKVAGPSTFSNKYDIIFDTETSNTTIRMTMPTGEICKSNPDTNYSTVFNIECSQDAEAAVIESNAFSALQCTNTINMKSKAACPFFNAYSVFNTIKSNKYIFGSILILAGIFFCFFGLKFIKITEMIAAGVAVTLLFIWLIFSNITLTYATWAFWITIAISVAFGILVMVLLGKYEWIGRGILGGLLGFVGGLFLYNLALRFIQSNPTVVFWLTMAVCIGLGIFITIWIGKPILVISTSIVGAYGIIRGASFMIGGFPDEREVYDLGQKGEWDQMSDLLSGYVYIYLGVFVVLSIVGMIIQFKYFYDDEEKKEKKDEENQKLNP
jgi:hypothetical protein